MSDKKDWFEAIAREDRKDARDEVLNEVLKQEVLKYGRYEDDPKAWLEKINQAHWEQTQAQAKPTTKTVWARISIEVEIEPEDDEEYSDEALMDTIAEELVQYGFTIDDMGMMNPTDLDKFYPETEETK